MGAYAVAAAAVALPVPPAKPRPQPVPRPEGIHHANAAVPAVVAPRVKVDQAAPRQHQAKRPLPKPLGPPRQPVLRQVAALEYNDEMFNLIADEPAKRRRKEEYDVENSTGLMNVRKRRAPHEQADYHQLSHLPWKGPRMELVEKVVAPINWNGNVPEYLVGLLLTDDLKKPKQPVKIHRIETQSSQNLKKAETRRFSGGSVCDNLQPPKDQYGNPGQCTENQCRTMKVFEGLPLYVGGATGGVIAISDSNAVNTDFVLEGSENRSVGGSPAAAQDDDEESAEDPQVRQWMLNIDPYKNNDGNKLTDIGPASSDELMKHFGFSSKGFPFGLETHQTNRYASNGQLIPFHIIEQRKSRAAVKVLNVWNNWHDWNIEPNKLHGICFVELLNLKLEGVDRCAACSVDGEFITDGYERIQRDWLRQHEHEGLPRRYFDCSPWETTWRRNNLDPTTRRIFGAYLFLNELCHWIDTLTRNWGNLNDTRPPWNVGLRCSHHGLYSIKEVADAVPHHMMNRPCERADIMNCIYYDLYTRRALEKYMRWPMKDAKQRIQCFRLTFKHPKSMPPGLYDFVSRKWIEGQSTTCWRSQNPDTLPTDGWTAIRPNILIQWCTTGICFIRVEFGHNSKVCPNLPAVSHELTPTIAQAFGGEGYHAGYLKDAAEVYKKGVLPREREASQHCSFIH